MEFDIVNCAGIKHQPPNELWQLPTFGENCNPIDSALPVMSVNALPKDGKKEPIKPNEVINGCDSTGATAPTRGYTGYGQLQHPSLRQRL